MTTLLHNHSFATEHVPLRAQLTCPTMFPDSLGNACDRPQLPMDLSQLCAECTWLTVLPDSCGSTYCGHSQLLNQLCARCTLIDSFRGSASLHPPCLSSPVDDVSAEVHILHRNINRAISATHHIRHSPPSAASHSAQPTLGCLTRHSPPSAASLGTAHPRLPHSAQPTLGCLTWHSPPSAASHSAQPTLGCLTLGTAHPRLPHLLGHSKVLQHFLEQHSFISQMQLQIMYMLMHLMSIQSHPLTSSSSSYIVRLLTGGEYCSGLGFDSPVRVFIAPPTLSLSQHVAPTLSLDLLSSSLSNYLFIIIIIYCRYIISYSTVPLP